MKPSLNIAGRRSTASSIAGWLFIGYYPRVTASSAVPRAALVVASS
jgi:hypothetical protein